MSPRRGGISIPPPNAILCFYQVVEIPMDKVITNALYT
jgi:hypothetical protein